MHFELSDLSLATIVHNRYQIILKMYVLSPKAGSSLQYVKSHTGGLAGDTANMP